jgi:hypothetical protein
MAFNVHAANGFPEWQNNLLCPDYNLTLQRCSPPFPKQVDAPYDLLRVIRLFQRPIITEIARLSRSPCDSRGQDHIDFRMIFANLPGKAETIKAASEANLGQNNINLFSGFQHRQGFGCVPSLGNLVAAIAQIVRDNHSYK